MSKHMQTIAGLPAEKFLNRRVRLVNKSAGHHRPATLLEVHDNGTATVKPDSHRGTDDVELDRIHPWWSQNPDLREEHHILVLESATDEVEELGDDQEDEEFDEPLNITLPAMELKEGFDLPAFISRVEELKAAMLEEATIQQMLKPVAKRKREAVEALNRMGVQLRPQSAK